MQEKQAASIASLEEELATSKQDTLSAKGEAETSVKEAIMAADKKVIRLTERTAKVSFVVASGAGQCSTLRQVYICNRSVLSITLIKCVWLGGDLSAVIQELDDFRKKSRAEADKEQKRVSSAAVNSAHA